MENTNPRLKTLIETVNLLTIDELEDRLEQLEEEERYLRSILRTRNLNGLRRRRKESKDV